MIRIMHPRGPALLSVLFSLLFVVGCGPRTGWLIKPVSTDRSLEETVVAKDKGWFIQDKIAIVDVEGLLVNARDTGLWGSQENPTSLFIEKLKKAAADEDVKGVVVRINSPGGGVTASDIMYKHLLEFRTQKSVPVVAAIEDVGASGAYYLACGTDQIMVHPTSITGSIGVIMQTVSVAGTMRMIGIDAKAVTSGPFKDLASPLKPLNDKDLAILQSIVDRFYERFLAVVAGGRPKMTKAKIRELADGRVYTGPEAVDNGLADEVGYVENAVAKVKQMAGVKRVKVVMYHRPLGYRADVYSETKVPAQVNLLNVSLPELLSAAQPEFLYLWTGHSPGE